MSRAPQNGSTPTWGRVLVIMPTYNEAESLEAVALHLLATVPGVDLLIVDDASPDGTGALADRIAASDPRVHVLHRERKDGLGRAYLAGFAWANARAYDTVVEMDADGSHPAQTLPGMLDLLSSAQPRPGVVIGSRWVPGGDVANWSKRRSWLSRSANNYARLALRIPVRDLTAGFRAYPLEVVMPLVDGVDSHGYAFQVELAARVFDAGHAILEVPITFSEREAGSSKMSGGIVLEAMFWLTKSAIARTFGRHP